MFGSIRKADHKCNKKILAVNLIIKHENTRKEVNVEHENDRYR